MTPPLPPPNPGTPDRASCPSSPPLAKLAAEETDPRDAALWDLLGRAGRPAPPSPYFARRVLREVAALEEGRRESPGHGGAGGDGGSVWRRLAAILGLSGAHRPRALAAVAGVLLLALSGAGFLWRSSSSDSALPGDGVLLAQGAGTPPASALPPVGRVSTEEGSGRNAEPITDRDLAVIADLEDLLDNQENRVWLEEDDTAS